MGLIADGKKHLDGMFSRFDTTPDRISCISHILGIFPFTSERNTLMGLIADGKKTFGWYV